MPSLLVLQGPDKGHRFRTVDGKTVVLGRASSDLRLSDYTVSRRHAELRPSGRGWIIEDLRSANGTYLNGRRIERPARLKNGDQVRIGGTLLVWDAAEEDSLRSPGEAAIFPDLVEVGSADDEAPAVIGSVAGGDDSMILASPAAAEAVRSWRVVSALLEAVGAMLTPPALVERILDVLFEEVPGERGFVLLKGPRTGKFDMQVVRRREPDDEKIRANKLVISHVIEKREGVLCSNTLSDPRFSGGERTDTSVGVGLVSVICVPMMAREEVIGVVYIESPMSKHIYTEEQLRVVAAIGQMGGLAIDNLRLVDERMRTERLAATGETVAALSHYIKNILQGMMGGSDLVEMGVRQQTWPMVDQGWQVVQRNLDKIYSLSMNMLAFAKSRTPRRAPVQLNSIVEDVLKLAQRRAEDKAVLLKHELSDMIPAVRMDEDGIHQVALNIVNNAIDAVSRGAGVVNVKTTLDPSGEFVVLGVGDNGPGIPPEAQARIFDAFYSTKGHGGTGLGLAVAKKIVDEHGGKIEVTSVENEGTIIRIKLPIHTGSSLDSEATHGPATAP